MNRPNIADLKAQSAKLKAEKAKAAEPVTLAELNEALVAAVPELVEKLPPAPKPKKDKPPRQPISKAEKMDNQHAVQGRLPNHSRFDVEYDAEKKEWSGWMYVADFESIHATHSGVFRLLAKLDNEYRRLKREREQKPQEKTDATA